jgi:phosphopantothenoylcysteine decarboxylase/phosphopantothenate--cysteine ligase
VIAANVGEHLLQGLEHINVESASDLEKELADSSGSFDLLVMAAAVADYRPAQVASEKIKRNETGPNLELSLVANPDILKAVTSRNASSRDVAVIVGFAAETGADLESLAVKKLQSKGCDYIVANDIGSGEVFDSDQNSVLFASNQGATRFSGSKYEIARAILEVVSSKVVRTTKGESG